MSALDDVFDSIGIGEDEDGVRYYIVNSKRLTYDGIKQAAAELAQLRTDRDEWQRRAEKAAHINAGDANGFDWKVLEFDMLRDDLAAAVTVLKLVQSTDDDKIRRVLSPMYGFARADVDALLARLEGGEK